MKMTILGMFFASLLGGGAAAAQTCAAPGAWHPTEPIGPGIHTDLCGGVDSVALFCDFLDSSNKNDAIFQINLGAGYAASKIVVAGSAQGFNPVIYLYSASCATGSGCVQSGDAGTPLPLTGTAPGAYFLAVSAASSDSSGACGPIALGTDGTFPVSLQSFSVE